MKMKPHLRSEVEINAQPKDNVETINKSLPVIGLKFLN